MNSTKIFKKFEDSKLFKQSTRYYQRYEQYIGLLSFVAGFAWDSLTLTRIDRLGDNLIILFYILLLGFLIILTNLIDDEIITHPLLKKYRSWYPSIMQFFFGGLFSAYVVFYFRSAALTRNWLFLLLLIVLLIANEFVRDRLSDMKLQFSLYYLTIFSFSIFALPMLLKKMGLWVFLLSGFLSLLFIGIILYIVHRPGWPQSGKSFRQLSLIIIAIYIVLNLFYILNWIPPVPLSMKAGGVYHSVRKEGDTYRLKFERAHWYAFWKDSDNPFHYQAGDTVFCFVSVFAPTKLEERIYHHWQYYDTRRNKWLTSDRLSYRISGGRDGGYRGFTYKTHIQPGQWRIDVENDSGQLLGRIDFQLQTVRAVSFPWKIIYK